MNYYSNDTYNEATWRNESAAAERDSARRDARDLADFHAGDSPALNAFLDATTPDAPGGRYIMECESALEEDMRRARFISELSTLQTISARYGRGAARVRKVA
jgi:hypothetical protein